MSKPRAGLAAPARTVALQVLGAVRESDAYANLLLPAAIAGARLDPRDAALATELCYGTLRRQGYYDAVIALAARRPCSAIDGPVLDVLRLSAHQLLSLRTAQHAVLDDAVRLVRRGGLTAAAGFVNGVLRTLTRSTPDQWRERVLGTAKTGDDRLALQHAHPAWVVRALRLSLRADGRAGELEELLDADNLGPRVSLAALPGLADGADVPGAEPGHWSPHGWIAPAGDPGELSAVREGRVRVQDEGSQLAALLLAGARRIEAGERWLDLCSGPGGKTALLGALGGTEVELDAVEVSPARAELVRRAVAALPRVPRVEVADGRTVGVLRPASYDRILVDAPCTGLGALRRRPEARWRKAPGDIPALTALQSELLDSARAALAPGGLLAYVTCSPHLAETRVQVAAFLRRYPELQQLDAPAVLAGIAIAPLELGEGPSVQLWPHRHGTDAMFMALVRAPGAE